MSSLLRDYFSAGGTYHEQLLQNLLHHHIYRHRSAGIKFDDVSINTLWWADDQKDFDYEVALIRAKELQPDSLENKILKRFDDHRNIKFENGRLFEPIAITPPKYDMVTLLGMNRIAKLATGSSTQSFTHYAAGTGTQQESLSDNRLLAEIPPPRPSLTSEGYREDTGSSMRFLGRFSATTQTARISEGAVFDSAIAGVPLFRTVFDTDGIIDHRQYQTFFSLSQSIAMISVT